MYRAFVATCFHLSCVYTEGWDCWVIWSCWRFEILPVFQFQFSKVTVPLTSSPTMDLRFLKFPYLYQHLLLSFFLTIAILVTVTYYILVVFIFICLIADCIDPLFMCFWLHVIFGGMSMQFLCSLLIGLLFKFLKI